MTVTPGLPSPHALTAQAVSAEALSMAPGGLPLGTVSPGNPVTLSLIRAVPTSMAMLTGLSTVSLVVRRAALVGARVVVCGHTAPWQSLTAAASIERNPAEPVLPEAVGTLPASFDRPLVVVAPAEAWETVAPLAHRAWTAAVVVLPRVDLPSMTIARATDVVMLGAVPRPHLPLVRSTLRLPGEAVADLTEQPWSRVLVVARGRYAPVELEPSFDEREDCAPPRERPSAQWRPTPPFWGERSFEDVAGLRTTPAAHGPSGPGERGERS